MNERNLEHVQQQRLKKGEILFIMTSKILPKH